ncbi:MAG: hypothetical protein LBL33_06235 [Tannerella sp.]|nr:hypothetical protein [Tannerella sp.]
MAWNISGLIAGNGAGATAFAGGLQMCGRKKLHFYLKQLAFLDMATNVRRIF